MFNFLVTASEGAWNGEPYFIDRSRFLEYTDDDTRFTFQSLSDDAKLQLTTFPTLFAYEDMHDEPARVGWIKDIHTRGSAVRVTYELSPEFPPISQQALGELVWELEIGAYELSRTHWAVKRANLIDTLQKAGLVPEQKTAELQESIDLPPVSRRDVINAAHQLQSLGHAGFDRMLLEFGVEGLEASRGQGGLMARANALATFAFERPATTADGMPLSRAIVEYAAATAAKDRAAAPAPLQSIFAPTSAPASLSDARPAAAASPSPLPAERKPVRPRAFIGHGGSPLWRELKDFLEEKLSISVQEFNSVSVVGLSNKERLIELLNSIDVGFVVLTAEDEQADGKRHPRMNVVHEVGLLQGKLGFERAVILLEEGCEEFSNIHGVGQIRFPPKDIARSFESIRDFLIREGLG